MGTRGVYGFVKNNVDKLTYNHFDSYFNGLGVDIVDFIRKTSIEEMNQIFDKIIMVKETDIPTVEQVIKCYQFANLNVGTQCVSDFYCLLRETQGDLFAYKNTELIYMIDDKDFIKNSLFCEYGYIINLDSEKLEIYIGGTKEKINNRYNTEPFEGYYQCELIKEYPLENIPENWIEECENLIKRYRRREFYI